MPSPKLICLIGAESTGKTTLARALATALKGVWVAEYLREFCDTHKRTPRQDEQQSILNTQILREQAALAEATSINAPYVFCDTAPLLTAVYSESVFADTSLYAEAISLHQRYAITLLLSPDLPWIADGIQRTGEHVRAPIDHMIRKQLNAHLLPYEVITGDGHDRTLAALHALVKH